MIRALLLLLVRIFRVARESDFNAAQDGRKSVSVDGNEYRRAIMLPGHSQRSRATSRTARRPGARFAAATPSSILQRSPTSARSWPIRFGLTG